MNTQPEKNTGAFACPKTLFGAVIGAAVVFLAFLFLSPHSEAARRLWIPVVVETNGSETILGETRQMEFWTPSARTKDYLEKFGGEVADREKWQILSNDDMLLQFGTLLHTNGSVFGYRREEVWGQGRTGYKPGWWWTLNVYTNYSAGDLARTYRDFWKSSQPMLVEVIDNRGSSDK